MKSVLSIDGGGIRGYSSLVILKALMEKTGEIERWFDLKSIRSICSSAPGPVDDEIRTDPTPGTMPTFEYRPCHYFDYIAGVGTGGIIATMLGRCRMNVGEAIETYQYICATIAERQIESPPPEFGRSKSVSKSRKASRKLKSHATEPVPALPSPNEEDKAHVQPDPKYHPIICSCDSGLQPLPSNASSNPPRFIIEDAILECLGANPHHTSTSDASCIYNNPSRTVLLQVCCLTARDSSKDDGIDLLSIGSAIHERANPTADNVQHRMRKHIHRIHQELSLRAEQLDCFYYCRLDVPSHGLQGIGVNEWRSEVVHDATFSQIEKATRAYLENEDTRFKLHNIATRLVVKRKFRAKTLQGGAVGPRCHRQMS